MTHDEFLTEMQDVLQTETTLTPVIALDELEEWDSLSIMATMAFLDKNFGVKMKLSDFKGLVTIGDLMDKVPLES